MPLLLLYGKKCTRWPGFYGRVVYRLRKTYDISYNKYGPIMSGMREKAQSVQTLWCSNGLSYTRTMKNKHRKPRPSAPIWHWWDADGCYNCPNRNNCNQCPNTKIYKKSRQLAMQYRKNKNIKEGDE